MSPCTSGSSIHGNIFFKPILLPKSSLIISFLIMLSLLPFNCFLKQLEITQCVTFEEFEIYRIIYRVFYLCIEFNKKRLEDIWLDTRDDIIEKVIRKLLASLKNVFRHKKFIGAYIGIWTDKEPTLKKIKV